MKWIVAGLAGLLLTAAGVSYSSKQAATTFTRLNQAYNRLATAGFHCTADSATGKLGSGFLLSRASATWSDAASLCKIGPMGPEWKGKVWVTFDSSMWQLRTIPENAGVRQWGAVIAFGDEDLLNEVDSMLDPSPFGS